MIGSVHDSEMAPREREGDSDAAEAVTAVTEGYTLWLAPEGRFTEDNRIFFNVTWREGRLPLTFSESAMAHGDAVLVGNLENLRITERDGIPWVAADVDWDQDELATEARRLVDEDRLRGVSVHLAGGRAVEFCRGAVSEAPSSDEVMAVAAEINDCDECVDCEEWGLGILDAVIGGAALVLIPAFSEAEVVVAGAQEIADLMAPPRHWFSDPGFSAPQGISISPEGRVSGHLAYWDSCHRGLPGCTKPPRSSTGYSLYHANATLTCDDGESLAVGCLTMNLNHADRRASAKTASDYYDHSGTVFAFVRVGEDEYGVWVAGALAPGLDPAVIEKARRMRLSGDWRPTPHGYELIAAQSVPVPGFVPSALIADGETVQTTTLGPAPETDPFMELVAPLIELSERTEAVLARLEALAASLEEEGDRQLSQVLAELKF